MYDLIIVGGGPGGAAATVYAARKRLKTLFITAEWGGQSTVSTDIQNWIGTPSISGADLAKSLKAHVEAYGQDVVTTLAPQTATHVEAHDDKVVVTTADGKTHEGATLLITTGSTRRKLGVPGADTFEHKGLTYCASCDGPLFSGQDVVVVGGGNAGFETAAQLLAYVKSVTLLDRNDAFRADEVTVQKVLSKPNMHALHFCEIVEVVGEKFVTGIKWRHQQTGEINHVPCTGIFVEVGLIPSTEWAKDAVTLNDRKQVVIDPRTQKSSHPRIWAAGDCTDVLYHQNNIAAGDAVRALEDIYLFIHAS
ncbi:MAG: FAD-dependent oxidoreductase [Candidatus Pacebacteria bacterium]|nr:FAD-dependent oxidoreductase [Candidatus Paceibacterota bacterium]